MIPALIITNEHIASLLETAHAKRTSDINSSIALATEAYNLAKEANNVVLIAKGLYQLSFYFMIQGRHAEALKYANDAISIFETLNDEKGVADAKFTIASVYYKSENLHLGLKFLTECLVTYKTYNDYPSQAKVHKAMGAIYEYFEDIVNAVKSYQLSIEAAEKAGDLNMKSNAYNPLSGIYLNQNKIDKAFELIELSIALKKQTGDVRGTAFALYGRGKIYTAKGLYKEAEEDFAAAVRIHTDAGEKLGLGMTLLKTAALFVAKGQLHKAADFAEQAFELASENKIRIIRSKSAFLLYQIFKKLEDITKALHYLEVYNAEQAANLNNQTSQIVSSYESIHKMQVNALHDKIQLERAEMLEKKNKAENAAKVRQDFLSNMSHEIRTPLNAIITISKLLKKTGNSDEDEMVETLQFASNNLLLLINDILDFTKLETGKVTLDKRPVNIQPLLKKVIGIYEHMAKEKGLQLLLNIDSNVEAAYELDETKLVQILGNLINNAIKFTDKGSVSVTLAVLQHTSKGSVLNFSVKDTGIGIPKNFISEAFEVFTQPKSITVKKHKGSGLGLAIVKQLVSLYGGEIKVDTEEGKGSNFYFDLLLTKAAKQSYIQPDAAKELNKLNILVVDDNNFNLIVASRLLKRWGLEVDCVKSGAEALAKTAANKYDVILMDIHMPEMDGYEATAQIKTNSKLNIDTPIYALTADIMADGKEDYVNSFTGFLRKPIELDELYASLEKVSNGVN
jgi:signal transduction histidine kinase/ActR/RegA family two-component response regulator